MGDISRADFALFMVSERSSLYSLPRLPTLEKANSNLSERQTLDVKGANYEVIR